MTERSAERRRSGGARALTSQEKWRLAVLGMSTFGLALSITIVSTYLPKVVQDSRPPRS